MFGRKTKQITELKRALRIAQQRYADAHTDGRDALHAADTAAERLARALRGCARARADEAKLAARLAQVQSQYDNAVGLDHPELDEGAHWQARRTDKPRGVLQ